MQTHDTLPVRALTTAAALAVVLTFLLLTPTIANASVRPVLAKSDCGSGYFCVWSSTNYSGTIQRISSTNNYRSITLSSTKSYYNNRSYRTWLHAEPNGGGSNLCINPGGSNGSTSGWQAYAEAAYLATITSC